MPCGRPLAPPDKGWALASEQSTTLDHANCKHVRTLTDDLSCSLGQHIRFLKEGPVLPSPTLAKYNHNFLNLFQQSLTSRVQHSVRNLNNHAPFAKNAMEPNTESRLQKSASTPHQHTPASFAADPSTEHNPRKEEATLKPYNQSQAIKCKPASLNSAPQRLLQQAHPLPAIQERDCHAINHHTQEPCQVTASQHASPAHSSVLRSRVIHSSRPMFQESATGANMRTGANSASRNRTRDMCIAQLAMLMMAVRYQGPAQPGRWE
eukprot:784839-Pelagomonas_calceolata.AAC.5